MSANIRNIRERVVEKTKMIRTLSEEQIHEIYSTEIARELKELHATADRLATLLDSHNVAANVPAKQLVFFEQGVLDTLRSALGELRRSV
jgi:thiamine kinase-like enzyme